MRLALNAIITTFLLLVFFNFAQAEKKLLSYLSNKPDDPLAHYLLGTVYQKTGKIEKAIDEFQMVLKYNPDFKLKDEP